MWNLFTIRIFVVRKFVLLDDFSAEE